ncbi:MAG: tyrosine-type recombinase/integrase [Acidimicrobiales bacterium]
MRHSALNDDFNPDQKWVEQNPDSSALETLFKEARSRLAVETTDETTCAQDPDALQGLNQASHPVHRYFANRNARPETMAGYRKKLQRVKALLGEAGMAGEHQDRDLYDFPWHMVDPPIAATFNALVVERYTAVKSRENLVGALRRVVRECATSKLISSGHRDAILSCLPVQKAPSKRVGNEIPISVLADLLREARRRPGARGARDAAILAVLMSTGLRVSELVDLGVADVDPQDRSLTVAHTKSGPPHRTWLHPSAMKTLNEWLEERGNHPGALFHALGAPGRPLHTSSVRNVVQRAQGALGLEHDYTPHDFRRTIITTCLRNGVDPFIVARLAGHRSVSTTMIYDRRNEEEDRAVIDRLPFPDSDRSGP